MKDIHVPPPQQMDDTELDERYLAYYGQRKSTPPPQESWVVGWLAPVAIAVLVLILWGCLWRG